MVATSFFLHILSHSPLAAISCNISFHLAGISLKFSFLHGSYFILCWILSHSPLAAISCNISFHLACISLKFHLFMVATSFFLQILSHSSLAAISSNISFLLAFISIKFSFLSNFHFYQIFISSWQLLHSPLDFVSFPPGSYFMQYFIPPGIYFN